MHLLAKSLCGEEIARELISVLQVDYKVSASALIGAMHDRASVNAVAMRTVQVIYPQILDIGCFSHTVDHVGDHFVTPVLDEFVSAWVLLFSHSPKSRLVWQSRVGRSVKSLSKTRWWSRWEVINQLMELFGDVEPFLLENDDLGPRTRTRMLSILQDPTKKASLMVEMAAVVDAGREFVKTTYNVEGDGPLVLECYERIQAAFASIHVRHYPNTDAVIKKLTAGAPAHVSQHWKLYAQSCIQPGLDYFVSRFTGELSSQLEAFKVARLFVPQKVVQLRPDASTVDSLKAFSFLRSDSLIASLKSELPTYLGRASNVATDVDPLQWWSQQITELPTWVSAFRQVLLIQPSSAAAERVFSLLTNSFGANQDLALQDYIESSLMLQYNGR